MYVVFFLGGGGEGEGFHIIYSSIDIYKGG